MITSVTTIIVLVLVIVIVVTLSSTSISILINASIVSLLPIIPSLIYHPNPVPLFFPAAITTSSSYFLPAIVITHPTPLSPTVFPSPPFKSATRTCAYGSIINYLGCCPEGITDTVMATIHKERGCWRCLY